MEITITHLIVAMIVCLCTTFALTIFLYSKINSLSKFTIAQLADLTEKLLAQNKITSSALDNTNRLADCMLWTSNISKQLSDQIENLTKVMKSHNKILTQHEEALCNLTPKQKSNDTTEHKRRGRPRKVENGI